jgi:hypothetical protein
MSKNLITRNVITFEFIVFGILVALLWTDEIFDIPHAVFGAKATPINWAESILETVLVLALCIVIVSLSWWFLKRIKYLEGLLSVCSFCKKVRVGKEWIPIEQYIQEHSEADFSHGLCPQCAEKYYEEYFPKDRLHTK